MSRPAPAPITLPEYERLFRILHAVVASEGGDPARACLFFAVAGAYLLKRQHRLDSACPVAGAAGYHLRTPDGFTLVFGRPQDGTLVADGDHFHCWIEVDGWIVDPMAPLFGEMAPAGRERAGIARCMFQKPALAATDMACLATPGAYLHVANHRLTTELMQGFTAKAAYADLVRICDRWYSRPPRKIAPGIGIGDQTGRTIRVELSPIRLSGAW